MGFDNARKLFLHQSKAELPAQPVQKELLFGGFFVCLGAKFRSQLKTHNIVSWVITYWNTLSCCTGKHWRGCNARACSTHGMSSRQPQDTSCCKPMRPSHAALHRHTLEVCRENDVFSEALFTVASVQVLFNPFKPLGVNFTKYSQILTAIKNGCHVNEFLIPSTTSPFGSTLVAFFWFSSVLRLTKKEFRYGIHCTSITLPSTCTLPHSGLIGLPFTPSHSHSCSYRWLLPCKALSIPVKLLNIELQNSNDQSVWCKHKHVLSLLFFTSLYFLWLLKHRLTFMWHCKHETWWSDEAPLVFQKTHFWQCYSPSFFFP